MQTIETFFKAYDRFNATGEGDGQDAFFAPTFMAASASGVRVMTPEQLALIGPRRRAMLDGVGRKSVTLLGVTEQPLDATYVMTTSTWRWQFEPRGGEPFDLILDATHILQRTPGGLRIVFYRTGDVMQALRERGIAV